MGFTDHPELCVLSMVLASYHPSGTWNLEVASRFLKKYGDYCIEVTDSRYSAT